MRIEYTIYDLATNDIIRTGTSSVSSYASKAQPGEGIIPESSNQRLQKVVDGKIVDKEPGEIIPEPVPFPRIARKLPTVKEWQDVLERLTNLET